jgi:hypothetical protein
MKMRINIQLQCFEQGAAAFLNGRFEGDGSAALEGITCN